MFRLLCALGIGGVLLILTGCAQPVAPTGTISGRVTMNGKPASGLVVSLFLPSRGVGASAVVGVDGSFEILEPIPTGEYVVTIMLPVPMPPTPGAAAPPPPAFQVPAKYGNDKTTDLRATVNPGANSVELKLSPNP
jgi:hypothetical protein